MRTVVLPGLVVTAVAALIVGCNAPEKPAPAAAVAAPSPVAAPAPKAQPIAVTPPAPKAVPTTQALTVIKSAPASIDAILAGTKTSTTRKGKRAYAIGPAVTSDGKRKVKIEITSIEPKRLANLTAADAASDGSDSLASYRAALIRNNPGLTDDDIVSVVHFKLADAK